jgi:enamine deaminase RidA (YjgF/YER057c/UK114 family)
MSVPVEVTVEPAGIGNRTGFSIVTAVSSSTPGSLAAAFEAVEAALAAAGLGLADVVRSRIVAASRPARDAASAIRFRQLSGPARAATSSYIDESRFAGGDGPRLDTVALRGTAATKVAVEREPPDIPCLYVVTGDLLFFSGMTSFDPELEAQVRQIRARLAEGLSRAEANLGRRVRPASATVYVHRSVALDELADLAESVGVAGLPLAIERCEGFANPGKLLELEIDAGVAGSG